MQCFSNGVLLVAATSYLDFPPRSWILIRSRKLAMSHQWSFSVTVRNSSCGKVTFSHLSVILLIEEVSGQTAPPGRHPPRQTPPLGRRPLGRHPSGQTPPLGRHPLGAGQTSPLPRQPLQRTVRILLECILVPLNFEKKFTFKTFYVMQCKVKCIMVL